MTDEDKDEDKDEEAEQLKDFYKLDPYVVDTYMEEMQRISEENARKTEERESKKEKEE